MFAKKRRKDRRTAQRQSAKRPKFETLEDRRMLSSVPVLVQDINTTTGGLNPSSFIEVGGELFFKADDEIHGAELWKTDGTAAGSVMVKDINPGSLGSSPRDMIDVDGTLYFVANDGVHGNELWKTDGTAAGTAMIKDINPGAGSGIFSTFHAINFGGTLLFAADDGANGRELWKSDGTAAGTQLLADIAPGTEESRPFDFTVLGSTVYFGARDSVGNGGLWKTDGTTAGTVVVTDDFDAAGDTNVKEVIDVNGTLFISVYANDAELWKSDGTAAGTVHLQTFGAGDVVAPRDLTSANGALYFRSYGDLWTSDGTTPGTTQLGVFDAGSNGDAIFEANGTVFFVADDGVIGNELWKTDGTPGGTVLVKDTYTGPGGFQPTDFVEFDNSLYFLAGATADREVWKSDGTGAGTVAVTDLELGVPHPGELINLNGSLFFAGNERATGLELWKTDGSIGGEQQVTDILLTTHGSLLNTGSIVSADVGGITYFLANDGSTGEELWRTNGTDAGTNLVKDIRVGPDGARFSRNSLTNVAGTLYFLADDGVNGRQLWKSDGTEVGTVRVSDIAAGAGQMNGREIVALDSNVFFTVEDHSTAEVELWVSDGTTTGTHIVKDINPGTASSSPGGLTVFNGKVYFQARDDVHGRELWVSDGTAAGTNMVTEIRPGPDGAGPGGLTEVNGSLFFVADDGTTGGELWKTDGTEAGTVFVKDINPGTDHSSPRSLSNHNGTLFFQADDGANGVELWKSDGTAAGTVLVKDIFPGDHEEEVFGGGTVLVPNNSRPTGFTSFEGSLYFYANNETVGTELWKTDGTSAGTVLVKDIDPGPQNGARGFFVPLNGELLFRANDDIWRTDGTAAGTVPAAVIPDDVSLQAYTSAGGTIMMSVNSPLTGDELWQLVDDANPAAAPVVNVPAGPETVDVFKSGTDLVVTKGAAELLRAPPGTIVGVTVNGAADSEIIRVNIDGLSPFQLPAGITLVAGEDGVNDTDTLLVIGSQTVTNYQYTTGGPESGTISMDGLEILFDQFEPIIDQISATNRTFKIGTSGSQTIVLADDAEPGQSLLDDGGTGAFESLSFRSPSNQFQIDAGDGDDTITVAQLDSEFGASVVVNGEGGDDTIDASTYNLAVTLSGGEGNDALTGGSGNDMLDGGDGNDTLSGGSGVDAVDGGTGSNDVEGDADDGTISINKGATLDLDVTFVDPVSATIDWGDSSSIDAGDVSGGTVSGSHAFSSEGEYEVIVTATDSQSVETTKTVTVIVTPLLQLVDIDVKPGGDENSINVDSNGKISVAVFSTAEFDATQIEASTVLFAGAYAVQSATEDVDNDGDLDLVLHFRTQDTALREIYEQLLADDLDGDGILDSTNQETEVTLTGETLQDTFFEGADDVDLFLKGKALRELLEELESAGAL